MVEPRIVPRQEHPISRRDIDPDALKVLYRLKDAEHTAYLVGGGVRDLLLGRRPKDFDIGTSAHPSQVKKLFRNCWIIGRRFRLAHVKFGAKVIEVATFRRQVIAGEEVVQDGVPAPDPTTPEGEQLIHHDNTFGTPEEDAFRRDFTINALAYDIATFSVIDFVGGLEDLRAGLVRSIGDPDVRLNEDPVRMIRAIAIAARLDFAIEPSLLKAIRTHRKEIAKSALPRLIEEYYKILRAGASEKSFRDMADVGLLEPISSELHRGADDRLWQSLAALDAYRGQFESTPDTMSNAILLGSLLVPLGISLHPPRVHAPAASHDPDEGTHSRRPRHPPGPRLGDLPLARRDVERLRLITSLQRRMHDLSASERTQRALAHRGIFREALTWMEIHGNAPEIVEHWMGILDDIGELGETAPPETAVEEQQQDPAVDGMPHKKRRRRRRRGRRGGGGHAS
ncbi:MAG TPA: polynucleotide adenylyltransferase PcnB [Vicinamibacterales bacterium]|nr:polynucleotide adenylyltransferase PcnB [Vicinamibacterales bacterium]